MSGLPARVILCVVAPAVVGGVVAWGTRSEGRGAADRSAGPGGAQSPVAVGVGDGTPSGVGVGDSALSEQRRFSERLRGASVEQMLELLVEAEAGSGAMHHQSVRELIFAQLVRTDPLKGWAFVESWEGGKYRHDFVLVWARFDAMGALTWADGRGGGEGNDFRRTIIVGLVPDDVDGLVAILPLLRPREIPERTLADAFLLLASDDADQARRLVESPAVGGQRNSAINGLAEGWARGHAEAAYGWAKALTEPSERESALRGVFRAWAESDPQRVADKLDELVQNGPKDELGEPLARGGSPVNAVVRAWAAQDPQSAANWLKSRSSDYPNEFQELFASEILSTRDDWSAAEVAEMMRRPGEEIVTGQSERLDDAVTVWGSDGEEPGYVVLGQFGNGESPLNFGGHPGEINSTRFADPAQAFADLAHQPGDASRQHVLQAVASQWVAKDPEAAMAKLHEITDDYLKIGLLNAFSNLARQTADPVLAAEVDKAYPDAMAEGRSLVNNVYSLIASRDPDYARSLLANDPQASRNVALVATLAHEQAAYDPVGAIDWAAGQPDEALQSAATRAAVRGWAEDDAFAVSEWLATQPASPRRDAAVQSLIGVLRSTAPEEALQWATTLSDPEARENEQTNIILDRMSRDTDAARGMVESTSFSEEAKRRLLENIEATEKVGR